MSDTTHFSARYVQSEKSCFKKCCFRFRRQFSFDGHISYAFIYGSWEIIRARKVGTTHTKLDYVVYRLFYPVILVGTCLFSVVNDSELSKYFSLLEVWAMIIHIAYAFIFLQNVLANNLHRDNVKHRQKIPERLVVTDEIEKGGHKFYICKRYSILPSDKLYLTEKLIWFLFNILASVNVWIMLGQILGLIQIDYKHMEDIESLRAYSMGVLILADVILTPIPMRLSHVIFPVLFFSFYHVYLGILFNHTGLVLYKSLDFTNEAEFYQRFFTKLGVLIIIHIALTGLSALRDYVISLLDDSRTPQQLQNLRSQKRLARRKLMNYIEGEDGRIIGISLDKHTFEPGHNEVIRKAHPQRSSEESEDSSKDEVFEGINMFKKKSRASMYGDEGGGDVKQSLHKMKSIGTTGENLPDIVPLTAKTLPPPVPRYTTPEKDETQFSSSSSSTDEELQAIISFSQRVASARSVPSNSRRRKSKVATKMSSASLHKFGVLVKPRDSKENIYHKLEHLDDSPPTPPFVKLVQTLITINKQKKLEEENERKRDLMTRGIKSDVKPIMKMRQGTATVRVVRSEDERKVVVKPQVGIPSKKDNVQQQGDRKSFQIGAHIASRGRGRGRSNQKTAFDKFIDQLPRASDRFKALAPKVEEEKQDDNKDGSKEGVGGKPVGARVVMVSGTDSIKDNQQDKGSDKAVSEFHQELTGKLEKERSRRLGSDDTGSKEIGNVSKEGKSSKKTKTKKKKKKRLKGILKNKDFDTAGDLGTLNSKQKKREQRLLKRREERALKGKHGKPAYDPLSVPEGAEDSTATTFHFVGTKLQGEKAEKTIVPVEDVPLYRTHPGIGTTDDAAVEEGETVSTVQQAKSIVTFHPIVKLFEVNEVKRNRRRGKRRVRLDNKPDWVI